MPATTNYLVKTSFERASDTGDDNDRNLLPKGEAGSNRERTSEKPPIPATTNYLVKTSFERASDTGDDNDRNLLCPKERQAPIERERTSEKPPMPATTNVLVKTSFERASDTGDDDDRNLLPKGGAGSNRESLRCRRQQSSW